MTYILRFIIFIIVFFFVKKLFSSVFRIGQKTRQRVPRDPGQEKTPLKGEQVEKDPVCGMFVAREAAVLLKDEGGDHYFCSEECRDKFLEGSKT